VRFRKRKKKPSKKFREEYGHTPLSAEEEIPWKCRGLVIATGAYGSLPVMKQVRLEAELRKIEVPRLLIVQAIKAFNESAEKTNASLHVIC
jgi:hypothetical protein